MPAHRLPTTPVRHEFADHCADLLSLAGPVRRKRMFGGHGFYIDDVFVAFTAGDRLYLKVDPTSRPRFEAAGCEPFVFVTKTSRVSMSFWSVPDEAMESSALLLPWARLAMEAALRARNAKPVNAARKPTHGGLGDNAVAPQRAPTRKQAARAAKHGTTQAPAAAETPKPALKRPSAARRKSTSASARKKDA